MKFDLFATVTKEGLMVDNELVHSMDDIVHLCVKNGTSRVICSSSVDFPEDYTDDPKVIALCYELRN